ncbi:AsmA family protein [uncultured Desulfuromonas sp.]|uniref:DUF748 domain-containing protein n=1 Tax=uncultured Desulfuromonas sp. TaxID=181013 RepID=UPI002622042A|nr:AsmA family protein [uncultured Desulfuromonas sp.]
MKKLGKYFGIGVAILVVLTIVFAILAKVLITPERVRDTLQPLAKKALHREVGLGAVEVSLLSGITLGDLVVAERDGADPFVAAEKVVLRYSLWPLLAGRVVVDEVRLVKPSIRVVRLADGSFNFSDLLGAGPVDPVQETEKSAEPEVTPDGQPLDLLVSEVSIAEGEILFLDHALGTEAPYRHKVSELELRARDISLEDAFPFDLSAVVNGGSLAVLGEANPKALSGSADVKMKGLDLVPFTPYFREALPGKLGSLKVSLDLALEGGAGKVSSSGKVGLDEIDLLLNALPDAPIQGGALHLDYALGVDLNAGRLDLERGVIAFNGVPLEVSGHVEDFLQSPVLALALVLKDLELEPSLSALPPGLVPELGELKPAGSVNARINLAGSTAEPMKLLRDGEIRLENVQASAGGARPALSGVIALEKDSFRSEGLKLVLGENRADIDLNGSNLYGKPIVISSAIRSDRFLIEPLLGTAAAPAAAAKKGGAGDQAPKAGSEVGPLDLPLRAEGTVQIGQTVYKGLAVNNFDMHYLLDKNILTVDRMTGEMAGGTLSETARVDLGQKGLAYTADLAFSGVQADPLVSAFAPKASGMIFGLLNFQTHMSGRGTLPETFKRSISGKGKLTLGDGKLTGAGLVVGLADFLGLPELRELRFSDAKGSFTIKDGRINLSSDFNGREVRLAPSGNVGLDGSLDVVLDGRLSPELTAKLDKAGRTSKFLRDAEGWGQLPLKVTGTMGSPRFTLDTTAAVEQVKEKAREKIEKTIQEKIFKKIDPGAAEGEGVEEPAKQLLEKTFKGLFGN